MNILYLCDEYPPGPHGGIGTSVRLLAREMVKMGHKVIVAGLYSPGYGGENQFEDEGVNVYRFRWNLDGKWFENRRSLLVRVSIRLLKFSGIVRWDIKRSLRRYKGQLEKIIAENQIDIIEMPDYNDYIRFCSTYIPFIKLSAPAIVKMHGSLSYFLREANKDVPAHVFKMEQEILNQAAAVAAVSGYTATKSAVYLSYPGKIEVLYNGINIYIPPGDIYRNPNQVIFTGSLTAKKGIFQLISAWNIVNKSLPEAGLLILGKGPAEKVASYLSVEAKNTVSFTGHLSAEKVYNYLSASSVSVFPSYAEAFALAPLEAMACGTAVINTNRASGPELIDDQVNGLLIDPDDIGAIAEAILYLLNNPGACAGMARGGLEKVREHFDISKIAVQNMQFYGSVLSRAI